jgi:hypothetical protein
MGSALAPIHAVCIQLPLRRHSAGYASQAREMRDFNCAPSRSLTIVLPTCSQILLLSCHSDTYLHRNHSDMSIPTPITIKTEPETAPITVKAEPGTIPITVKAEPGTIPPIINAGPVAEAVASSSTPRRKVSLSQVPRPVHHTNYQSSRVSQASQKVLEENDIYAVEKIIARSLHEGLGPDGRYEHQYLVRWEGYGPGDDTWEMSSNILQGSAEIVKAYESKGESRTPSFLYPNLALLRGG